MRRQFLLAIALALTLGSPRATAQDSLSLSVVDARAALGRQRAWRGLSAYVGSCNYGVYQLSESVGLGNRINTLRDDLAMRLDPRAEVSNLTITRYDVFLNRALVLKTEAMAMITPIGQVVVGGPQRPSRERDRMTFGWFDPSEATTPNSPLIIEIAASTNGHDFAVRSVYSPDIELPSQSENPFGFSHPNLQRAEQLAAFRAAMSKAHEALATEINSALVP